MSLGFWGPLNGVSETLLTIPTKIIRHVVSVGSWMTSVITIDIKYSHNLVLNIVLSYRYSK